MAKDNTKGQPKDENQQQFRVHRVYLKGSSFEVQDVPEVFKTIKQPLKNNLEMKINHKQLENEENLYEVTLDITVEAKEEEKSIYKTNIKQSGIFELKGFAKEQLESLLASYCPSVLFPYVNQELSERSTKGTLPAMMLPPVNFDALYRQGKKQQEEQKDQAMQEKESIVEH